MIFALDLETTTYNKGDPFDPRNHLCNIGIYSPTLGRKSWKIEYDSEPYGEKLKEISALLDKATCVCGHNFKRDIHWLRLYNLPIPRSIFDTQLAAYTLSHQRDMFPSVARLAAKYGLGIKVDLEKYWNEGINTTEIPYEEVKDRVETDAELTYGIYENQIKELEQQGLLKLVEIHCLDTLVLEEMEWNGMKYNLEKSHDLARETEESIKELDVKLHEYVASLVHMGASINFGSGHHLSAILFGGSIKYKIREQYQITLKSGIIRTREHTVEKEHIIKQGMFPPNLGIETKHKGVFETNKAILRSLIRKASKDVENFLRLLLARSELEQLLSTYYEGIPKKFISMNWSNEIIHPTLHQTSTANARLSCSNPNLQNQSKKSKICFESRFK